MTRTPLCKIRHCKTSAKLKGSKPKFNGREKKTGILNCLSDKYFIIVYYFKTEKHKYNFFSYQLLSKPAKVGRSKPPPVLTSGFNRLKPPRSICQKWSILVNTNLSGRLKILKDVFVVEIFVQDLCSSY